MKSSIVSFLVGAVIVGGSSFYGGMHYAQSQTPQRGNGMFAIMGNNGAIRGQRNGRGGMMGGGFTGGEIIAKDDKSITIKMPDGGSKIIFYSGSTEIGKFTSGAPTDLIIGKIVSVRGSVNQDGSITAQSLQLRPNLPSPIPSVNK